MAGSGTDKLRQVIRDQHGLTCTPVRSEPVLETFNGETVWDGVVEVSPLNIARVGNSA